MNTDAIEGVIRAAGRVPVHGINPAGPTMGILLEPRRKMAVWSNIPIDDASDVRFAKFLISEAKKHDTPQTY